jgi:hypothetical protein
MKKKFIPQIGSNNTVRLFDTQSGQLYKIINVGGEIISQPICLDSEMYVTVKSGNATTIRYFSLPGGGLKRVQTIN